MTSKILESIFRIRIFRDYSRLAASVMSRFHGKEGMKALFKFHIDRKKRERIRNERETESSDILMQSSVESEMERETKRQRQSKERESDDSEQSQTQSLLYLAKIKEKNDLKINEEKDQKKEEDLEEEKYQQNMDFWWHIDRDNSEQSQSQSLLHLAKIEEENYLKMQEEKEQKKREDLEEENYEQNMDLWWRNYMSTYVNNVNYMSKSEYGDLARPRHRQ